MVTPEMVPLIPPYGLGFRLEGLVPAPHKCVVLTLFEGLWAMILPSLRVPPVGTEGSGKKIQTIYCLGFRGWKRKGKYNLRFMAEGTDQYTQTASFCAVYMRYPKP